MQTLRQGLLPYVPKFIWGYSLTDMKKIFRPDASNFHQPIFLRDLFCHDKWKGLNFRKMSENWESLEFEFYVDGKKKWRRPDIVNVTPCIAFRSDLRDKVLPKEHADVELLPIIVSGEEWLILNCLKSVDAIIESRSILHRDDSGVIFMVQKLVVSESAVHDVDFFAVDGSNRSFIYLLEPFVRHLEALKIEGITFTEIGETVSTDENSLE